MTYEENKREAIILLSKKIAEYGYISGYSEIGTHGFFSDGKKVVSFQIDFFAISFSGNYRSKDSGSGYILTNEYSWGNIEEWATKDVFDKLIEFNLAYDAYAFTSLEKYLEMYQSSSKYFIIYPTKNNPMKTFKGRFVRSGNEPSGIAYTFNTEEEIKENETYSLTEYHDPVHVDEIIPYQESIELNGKEIKIKVVTLRTEMEETDGERTV